MSPPSQWCVYCEDDTHNSEDCNLDCSPIYDVAPRTAPVLVKKKHHVLRTLVIILVLAYLMTMALIATAPQVRPLPATPVPGKPVIATHHG